MTDSNNNTDIRRMLEDGRVGEAVDRLLTRRGAAFFGYIAGIVRDDALAADAFQMFSVRLWQSLASFRWESRLETWAYRIARNAAYRALDDPHRRRGERLGTAQQEDLAARLTRTTTAQWQQTEAKSRLWASIEVLPPQDRELLVLRLGRRMSWKEAASIIYSEDHGEEHGEEHGEDEIKRLAASLRKRFERIKARLATIVDASEP